MIMYLAHLVTFLLAFYLVYTVFGDSLWLRSGGEHSDPEPAVEVRPAGISLIQRLLFGSSRDHCDLELAVEVRRRRRQDS